MVIICSSTQYRTVCHSNLSRKSFITGSKITQTTCFAKHSCWRNIQISKESLPNEQKTLFRITMNNISAHRLLFQTLKLQTAWIWVLYIHASFILQSMFCYILLKYIVSSITDGITDAIKLTTTKGPRRDLEESTGICAVNHRKKRRW